MNEENVRPSTWKTVWKTSQPNYSHSISKLCAVFFFFVHGTFRHIIFFRVSCALTISHSFKRANNGCTRRIKIYWTSFRQWTRAQERRRDNDYFFSLKIERSSKRFETPNRTRFVQTGTTTRCLAFNVRRKNRNDDGFRSILEHGHNNNNNKRFAAHIFRRYLNADGSKKKTNITGRKKKITDTIYNYTYNSYTELKHDEYKRERGKKTKK